MSHLRWQRGKEAKDGFSALLDTPRAEAVKIEKPGRPVVVVLSTLEHDRLLSGASWGRENSGDRAKDDALSQTRRDRIARADER